MTGLKNNLYVYLYHNKKWSSLPIILHIIIYFMEKKSFASMQAYSAFIEKNEENL